MISHKCIIDGLILFALLYDVKAQSSCPCSQCFGDQDLFLLKFFEDGSSVNEDQVLSIVKANNTINGLVIILVKSFLIN